LKKNKQLTKDKTSPIELSKNNKKAKSYGLGMFVEAFIDKITKWKVSILSVMSKVPLISRSLISISKTESR
jgi:hypothetical protein